MTSLSRMLAHVGVRELYLAYILHDGAASTQLRIVTDRRATRKINRLARATKSARGAAAAVPYVPDLSGLYPVELQVRIAQMLSTVGLLSGAEVCAASAATPKIYVKYKHALQTVYESQLCCFCETPQFAPNAFVRRRSCFCETPQFAQLLL